MSKKVSIDAGHGMNTAGKRTPKLTKDLVIDGKVVREKGKCIHEFEWNIGVTKYFETAFKRCGGQVKLVNDRDGSSDTSLSKRASSSNNWGADLHISFHYNAFGGCNKFLDRPGGLLVLRTQNCSTKSIEIGKLVANQLYKDMKPAYTYGLRKDVDISGFTLGILRQTNCPAILIEFGFMDVWAEAKLMLDKKHQKLCGESVCKAVCTFFGMKYIEPPKPKPVDPNAFKPYYVKVVCDELNGRNGAGTQYDIVQKLKEGEAVTIIQEKKLTSGAKWGKTKTGYWINLNSKYVQFLRYI